MPRERIAAPYPAGVPVSAIVVKSRTVEIHEAQDNPVGLAKPEVVSRTEIHNTVPFGERTEPPSE